METEKIAEKAKEVGTNIVEGAEKLGTEIKEGASHLVSTVSGIFHHHDEKSAPAETTSEKASV
jgi:hypothetical protein